MVAFDSFIGKLYNRIRDGHLQPRRRHVAFNLRVQFNIVGKVPQWNKPCRRKRCPSPGNVGPLWDFASTTNRRRTNDQESRTCGSNGLPSRPGCLLLRGDRRGRNGGQLSRYGRALSERNLQVYHAEGVSACGVGVVSKEKCAGTKAGRKSRFAFSRGGWNALVSVLKLNKKMRGLWYPRIFAFKEQAWL